MKIANIEKVERTNGVASTVKADDFIQQYSEGVERFLRDNQSIGDEWVQIAGSKLYNFQGKSKEGDVLGSSIDMGVAIATFTDIPLITGQQLLKLYNQAGKKNPFGAVYIDFGVQVEGAPKVNSVQAKILMDDFNRRKIKIENGIVPNFSQLRLIADKDAGLAYKLAEDVTEVAPVSAYPFYNVEKNGLFGAYLGRFGWLAYGDYLAFSYDYGRVVRYDAEGVAHKKSKEDLTATLTKEFRKRF